MSNDRRLSLSCGDFKCDIVGYDEPSAILDKVVALFSGIARTDGLASFGADMREDALQALRAALTQNREKITASAGVEMTEGRLVFTAHEPKNGPAHPRIRIVRGAGARARDAEDAVAPGSGEDTPLMRALDQLNGPSDRGSGPPDNFLFSDLDAQGAITPRDR